MDIWYPDPRVEDRLTKIGARFEYRKGIPISSLDIEQSKKNNARFGDPIDEELCLKYAFQMSKGVRFPAIVISPSGIIWDGNQRIYSAQTADVQYVDAYVVINAVDEIKEHFCRHFNTTHGKGLDIEHKLAQVVALHEENKRFGKNQSRRELCNEFFAPTEANYRKVNNAINANEVRNQLLRCGIDATKISDSILTKLYTLHPENGGVKNTKLLKTASDLIVKYKIGLDDVQDMLRLIKTKYTEREQIAAMKDFAKNAVQAPPRKRKKVNVVLNLEKQLDGIIKLEKTGKVTLGSMGAGANDVKRIKQKITKASKFINTLKKNQ